MNNVRSLPVQHYMDGERVVKDESVAAETLIHITVNGETLVNLLGITGGFRRAGERTSHDSILTSISTTLSRWIQRWSTEPWKSLFLLAAKRFWLSVMAS